MSTSGFAARSVTSSLTRTGCCHGSSRYLDEHDIEFVTIEAALALSLEREVPVGSVVPSHRMMVVRGFARYLSGIDGPPGPPGRSVTRTGGGARSSTQTRTCSR